MLYRHKQKVLGLFEGEYLPVSELFAGPRTHIHSAQLSVFIQFYNRYNLYIIYI